MNPLQILLWSTKIRFHPLDSIAIKEEDVDVRKIDHFRVELSLSPPNLQI